ncbi:MAG: hypothetical protein WC508_03380 [Patescibacteria group bacterium]
MLCSGYEELTDDELSETFRLVEEWLDRSASESDVPKQPYLDACPNLSAKSLFCYRIMNL